MTLLHDFSPKVAMRGNICRQWGSSHLLPKIFVSCPLWWVEW